MLRHVGRRWLKFENGQVIANNTQHVAAGLPNNVAICCVNMLRSFGWGLLAITFGHSCTSVNWVPCCSQRRPDRYNCTLPVQQQKQQFQSCRKGGYGCTSGKRSVGFFQEGLQNRMDERSNEKASWNEQTSRQVWNVDVGTF